MKNLSRRQEPWHWKFHLLLVLLIVLLGFIFNRVFVYKPEVLAAETLPVASPITSPVPTSTPTATVAEIVSAKPYDIYVGEFVDEYFENPAQQSEVRMIMHCLLYRETKHDLSKGHGDGGLAGGPLQYHEATWEGFRKIMVNKGLVTEIGSRYDVKESIRTTVWAIEDGRALNWGPLLRNYNGQNYADCPYPSFYER
ncbi:MAG: hypothetical protein NUV69_04770 [Candidatus Curtissbacteria bacterium]|nr:hypothetical protein [Candidatus Curtissbacteria bacterium]